MAGPVDIEKYRGQKTADVKTIPEKAEALFAKHAWARETFPSLRQRIGFFIRTGIYPGRHSFENTCTRLERQIDRYLDGYLIDPALETIAEMHILMVEKNKKSRQLKDPEIIPFKPKQTSSDDDV
jgi:hypothetical protein